MLKKNNALNRNQGKASENTSPFPLLKIRPFVPSDLQPIPHEWRVGGPDFIGMGTIKAGTSWWYSLLLDHPQIVNNRLKRKELRFFVHFGYAGLKKTDIATYKQAFAAPQGSLCGEWSPIYLSHPLCTEYIAEAVPGTKILIILRNPIDRVTSFINEAAYGSDHFNFTSKQRYVFNRFNTYPKAMRSSFCHDDLCRLLRYFDHRQILILQYEKCKADPLTEIARTYRFLGVDDRYQPENVGRSINRKNYLVSELTPGERRRLADYFTEDVQLTMGLFPELDLSLWKDFVCCE